MVNILIKSTKKYRIFVITIKLFLLLSVYFIVNLLPNNNTVSTYLYIITIILNIYILYECKSNYKIFILIFMMFYFNMSIIIGEYIFPSLVYSEKVLKIEYYYCIAIKMVFLFIFVISLFANLKSFKFNLIKPKNNNIVFIILYIGLFISLIFGIDRSDVTTYTSKESPLYEYAVLVFLFAWYYSGNKSINKILLLLFGLIYILQGYYFGDRASATQILIIIALTFFKKISTKKMLIYSVLGIITNITVSIYRKFYDFNIVSIINTILEKGIIMVVSDTANSAYYSSVTVIAASEVIENKISFFVEFIKYVFLGVNNPEANLVKYVKNEYFSNSMGGLLPSFFYFWFGYIGVILIAMYIVFIINYIGAKKTDYASLFILYNIATFPRWYLYSPTNLFRGGVLFFSLMFFICLIINSITMRTKLRGD